MTPRENQLLELAHKIIINSMHGSAHPTGIRVWKENMAEYTRLRAELEKEDVGSETAKSAEQIMAENSLYTLDQIELCKKDHMILFDSNEVLKLMRLFASQGIVLPEDGSVINPYEPESPEYSAWESGYNTLYDVIKYLNGSHQFASQHPAPNMPTDEECDHPYAFVYRKMDYEICHKCGKVLCEG